MAEDLEELQRRALLREVDEELRSDELKAMWKKYRFYIISAICLALLGALIFEGIKYYQKELSTKDSLAYSRALDAAAAGDLTVANIDLDAIMKDKATGYAELASLRSVALLEKSGQADEALALLYEIKDNKSFSEPARNAASIALAQRLLDAANPNFAEIEALLTPLASGTSAWKEIASELLASIKN